MDDLRPLPFAAGRHYAVLGLGRSGLSAGQALLASGAAVSAWDDQAETRAAADAAGLSATPLEGLDWAGVSALVLSPGVPHSFPTPHPAAAAAKAAGVPLIADVELFAQSKPLAPVAAITGTNGKSTTTALIAHLLRYSQRSVAEGGNLGPPVLRLPQLGVEGVYVLELSSYQLELVESLHPRVAVFLNITPDHLDRHGGFEGYLAAKERIFGGQRAEDLAIVGVEEEAGALLADRLVTAGRTRVLRLSMTETLPGGLYLRDGWLIDDTAGRATRLLPLASLPRLPGRHNAQNVAAAYAACRGLGLTKAAILKALPHFPGLAHRQELVAEQDGLRFVNDSKATNAEAAAKALASYDRIYWIAGGRPKEGGLSGLDAFYPRIRRAFLIGEAQEDFARSLAGKVTADCCGTLEAAVAAATKAARAEPEPGAVVLLSPACASFDLFPNFEARGEAFRAAVQSQLEETTP
ncbi:MAG: UDP-N-acetylmuramoyl-L-alanine--D-glutamate ligase [Pseudomonadota bacterium]